MPNIRQNVGFQPSQETLIKWLGTRKTEKIKGGITLPGLFQTYNYETDLSAVIIVVILEFIGFLALIIAWKRLDVVAIGVVFSFLLVDVFCALRLHKNHWRFVLYNNQKIVQRVDLGDGELSSEKFIIKTCKLAIIIVALLKIYAFVILSYKINGITLLVILLYAIIAAIHIYNTGYWLAEVRTKLSLKKDYKAFTKSLKESENLPNNSKYQIINSADNHSVVIDNVILKELQVGQHSLTKKNGTEISYEFKSVGVLTDKELEYFIDSQTENDKHIVARKGLQLQLEIIGQFLN